MRWLVGVSTVVVEPMIGAPRGAGQEIAAVVSPSAVRSHQFAAVREIPLGTADFGYVPADPLIDSVSIPSITEKHHLKALTLAEAVDVVQAARRAGRVFVTNHHLRTVAGQGSPAATGMDGGASLAVALAVREAGRTGQRQLKKVPA